MAKALYIGAPTFIDGYTTLEYIESTGTQYINTGYKPNSGTRVVIEASFSENSANTSGSSNVFGSYGVDADYQFAFSYGKDHISLSTAATMRGFDASICDGSKHTIDCSPSKLIVDGKVYFDGSQTASSPYDLFLFAGNNEGEIFNPAKMKLYSCKIHNNGTLVRDFVPAKIGDDVGLLDLLTNRLYPNKGTGSFIAGPITGNVGGTVTADRARKIIQLYIGVDGVARKVRKIYVGDENGKARLVYAKTYKVRITGSSWHDGGDWGNHMAVVDINGKLYREGLVDLEVESGAAVSIELRHNNGCPASYKRVYLNGVLLFSGTKSGSEYYKYYIKGDTVINFVDGGDRDNGWAAGEVHITET